MIKWIFFDLGSTLVDETEAYDHRAREMIAGTDISFQQFDDARIALARKGLDGNSAAISFFGLTKTPWHSEDELPYPDTHSTLAALLDRGYRLGIIANQNSGTRERLEKWELLKFFDVVVASSDVGYSKPDIKIFEKAFELADCTADDSLMVGDRLDNDMIPAKALGMKTVWLKQGLAKYQENDIADYQIYSLNEILSIL